MDEVAAGHLQACLVHRGLEQLPVLGCSDRVQVGADELDVVALEGTPLPELDRGVQGRLSTERGQQCLGTLDLDDAFADLSRDRFHVGAISHLGISHDRGRVAVDQDDLVPLLLQGLAGLRTGIVELAGLSDHDRTRTY